MIAADAMTPAPRSLPPTAPLADAIHLLRDEGVRHLPVTEDGHVVGMLSDRDLRELSLGAVLAEEPATFHARLDQPIGPLAQPDVATVSPETELRVVVDLLLERRIGAVPVVEKDGGKLVGVVSAVDVLRAVRDLI